MSSTHMLYSFNNTWGVPNAVATSQFNKIATSPREAVLTHTPYRLNRVILTLRVSSQHNKTALFP